ncbi:MAG: site-specific DNA-methyltransferase [Planctomycetes bacterium]|nr:site-specific DNA-methyltransferase [Planctomycetota bacterium]
MGDARQMTGLGDDTIDLIVTSPPYPMITMWDALFGELDGDITRELEATDGNRAFESMHAILDAVWAESWRVVRPGGIVCINVGDATRTIGGNFQLFSNHARIIRAMNRIGFSSLPDILWRKPTNAPNKFMGSGMLPAGAYVTYEHEYVLIFRKGPKRAFATAESKARRRRSAFFWEERNQWFSDLWSDLRGVSQPLGDPDTRSRSAAFPFELAYRLIQMHSVQDDTVLDPFAGLGTTMAAALASGRHSCGVERDASLAAPISQVLEASLEFGSWRAHQRLSDHRDFVEARIAAGKSFKHRHERLGFPVVTSQETDLEFIVPRSLRAGGRGTWEAELEAVTVAE